MSLTDFLPEPPRLVGKQPEHPGLPWPVTAMCLVDKGTEFPVLYVASGNKVYTLVKRDGEDVLVPLKVLGE